MPRGFTFFAVEPHIRRATTSSRGQPDMDQRHQIKTFVLQNFLFSEDHGALGDADSLIRGGVIDSTGIHELILFLEESFAIRVAPEEMTPANFDSIQAVDDFVARKRTG
jgi:acyl carrier protein